MRPAGASQPAGPLELHAELDGKTVVIVTADGPPQDSQVFVHAPRSTRRCAVKASRLKLLGLRRAGAA